MFLRTLLKKSINGLAVFCLPFFVLIQSECNAKFEYNTQNKAAYLDITKLKISSGEEILSQAIKKDPSNGINIYLENYLDVIKLFVSDDEDTFQKLKSNETKRLNLLQKLEANSPYYKFTQAEIKIQWAFIKLRFNEDLSAAWSLRQAYNLLEENKKKFPDFSPNDKSLGLLHILLGSIPSKYQWIVNFMGMHGSVQKGILELKSAIEKNDVYQLESHITLVLVKAFILKDQKSIYGLLEDLTNINRDNLLLPLAYASVLINNGKSEKAQNILLTRPQSSDYIDIPHLKRLLGDTYLYKGDYTLAKTQYLDFLGSYKGKNFIKDTYFKLYLSDWFAGSDGKENKYLENINNFGRATFDTDKRAQEFYNKHHEYNRVLTRARFFCDGGYYAQAENLINGLSINSFSSKKDKIEFYYRKARIYHAQEKWEEAIQYYEKAINITVLQDRYYFAPNACLQLGYIYKEKNNIKLAKHFFEKALLYDNHEYKNSIDNKAKAALNEF